MTNMAVGLKRKATPTSNTHQTTNTSRSLTDRIESLEAALSNLKNGVPHQDSTTHLTDSGNDQDSQDNGHDILVGGAEWAAQQQTLLDEYLLTQRNEGLNELNDQFKDGKIGEIERDEGEYKLLKAEWAERRRLDPSYSDFYSNACQTMHGRIVRLSESISEKRTYAWHLEHALIPAYSEGGKVWGENHEADRQDGHQARTMLSNPDSSIQNGGRNLLKFVKSDARELERKANLARLEADYKRLTAK